MRLKWLAVAALISVLAAGKAEASTVYSFTNAGALGRIGPDQTAVNSAYTATTLAGAVTVTGSGIQDWIVPTSGLYHITGAGAQGASGDPAQSGGVGAVISGDFFLTAGQLLQIAVGQMGLGFASPQDTGSNGGGGGGSFVVDSLNAPLLVAGGGGGTRVDVLVNGIDGQAGQAGTTGSTFDATGSGAGTPTATIGQGGSVVNPAGFTWGAAGAGFLGDGANDLTYGTGGSSWANGLLGGQIGSEPHQLYLIYPQGNPLSATEDSPYLQIGESKYGRPILDRGVRFRLTTLEEAAKFALISLDSTIRSNVTVGPPIDLVVYKADDLRVARYRRFTAKDPDLQRIHLQWEHALRKAVLELPEVAFEEGHDQVI